MTCDDLGDVSIHAVLEGGPSDLPAEARHCRLPVPDTKIKVPHNGGYEHFEREIDDSTPAVYRWTTRTRVAE